MTMTWWWSILAPGPWTLWTALLLETEAKSFARSNQMKMDFSIWPIISKRSASLRSMCPTCASCTYSACQILSHLH